MGGAVIATLLQAAKPLPEIVFLRKAPSTSPPADGNGIRGTVPRQRDLGRQTLFGCVLCKARTRNPATAKNTAAVIADSRLTR